MLISAVAVVVLLIIYNFAGSDVGPLVLITGLIAGLYTKDYELIGRSLNDVIVEPARKHLIPNFDNVKNAALQNGALGSGISGAGPSIFALCKGEKIAISVAKSMDDAYAHTGISFDIHISKVNDEGTKIITN